MTKRLFIFNNECEMAIANRLPHYSPPRNIVQMRNELSCLMSYFTEKGDYVLCDRYPDMKYMELMEQLGINVQYITVGDIVQGNEFSYIPWGNAPNVSRDMGLMGIEPYFHSWSDEMRDRVSRNSTIACIDMWNNLYPEESIPKVLVAKSMTEIEKIALEGACVVKAPWSSSGKGVLFLDKGLGKKEAEWISGILRKQDNVTVEKAHIRVQDFGLEYLINQQGEVIFIGASLFYTGGNGEYIGNKVACSDRIEQELGLSSKIMDQVSQVLSQTVGKWYRGYLGVDMLMTDKNIVPFIEINYRLNMGILALALYNKVCESNATGIFSIKQYGVGEAQTHYNALSKEFSNSGKLLSGTLALTPIYKDTRFVAEITID